MTKTELLSLRQELEFKIEAMIRILDLIDGDSDFEPYLAGFSTDPARTDDREDESELLEHGDEDTACDDFPIDDDELDTDPSVWGYTRASSRKTARHTSAISSSN
jgi:hypothetical protein